MLQTKVGRVTLYVEPNRGEGLGTVVGHFANRAAAKEEVPCNLDGTWLNHYFAGWTVEAAISHFLSELRMVLR